MKMPAWSVLTACGALLLASACMAGEGEEKTGGPEPILDTYSYWRASLVFRPAVLAEKADGATVPEGAPRTPVPPADWVKPDFDDGTWFRTAGPAFPGGMGDSTGYGTLRYGGGSHEISLLCLRGKFAVPDPAKVESLTVSARYRGGIVVYLNGQEVARAHLPAGELTAESLAEEYPWEAYVGADGKTPPNMSGGRVPEDARPHLELRVRGLSDVQLPVSALRKGVNVLAIELHRAPVHPKSADFPNAYSHNWSTLGLNDVGLTAGPAGAVTPNIGRPAGIQLWSEDALADVYDQDYGDPNETLRPLSMSGVRNGAFSSQLVVGSDKPIRGLKAAVSDLRTADGKSVIGAGSIGVFYPLATGQGGQDGRHFRGARDVARFDGLCPSPPEEVPVREPRPPKNYSGRLPIPGAVQPIWIEVRLPGDAAAGDYEGTLTVGAEDLTDTRVPVRLRVFDWTLPDPSDYATHLGVIQSIDSLALRYDVPPWSEKHWSLIEKSFEILGRNGVDALFLPMVCRHHFGKEALIRWVRNEDGTLSPDYEVFNKYVGIALKHVKKPEVVCFYLWDPACRSVNPRYPERPPNPVPLPLLDRKTGKVTEMDGPLYNSSEFTAFWKPVLDTCRAKLKELGVEDKALMMGMSGDGIAAPSKEEFDNLFKAAPWVTWVQHAHAPGGSLHGLRMGHSAEVWGATNFPDPGLRGPRTLKRFFYGWKRDYVRTAFPRVGADPTLLRDDTSVVGCRMIEECCLLAGLRGVARVGAEFWALPGKVEETDARGIGGTPTVLGLYSEWGRTSMGNSAHELLAPGPEGPLSTIRLETVHQGAQEAQARVFLEKALEEGAGKLAIDGLSPEETAARIQDMLDERARVFILYRSLQDWYVGSGWADRSEELYSTAAKVAGALQSK